MQRTGWSTAVMAAVVLAVVSLVSNITSLAQLSGEADAFLAVRFTVSKVVNAGVVWAGLAVFAGWSVKRPGQGFLAGIAACILALGAHYGLGVLLGIFPAEVWTANAYWFAAAAILGGPLGLVGSLARRSGVLGLAARLLVPVAALLEPWVTGKFSTPDFLPWPDRVSDAGSGIVLLVGGAAGVLLVARRALRQELLRGRPTRLDHARQLAG